MREIIPAPTKLTKKQIDEAMANGITHAKMTSRKVTKRMLKAAADFKIKQERAANKVRQEEKKFDQFLDKQNINLAAKKFEDFEKEVSALSAQAAAVAPLGETFPEVVNVKTLDYVDSIGEAVTEPRVYNHETGDFDPVPVSEDGLVEGVPLDTREYERANSENFGSAPITHVFTSDHGGRGKAIPIATIFETMPEPAEDCTTTAQVVAEADQSSDVAPDHSFQLPA